MRMSAAGLGSSGQRQVVTCQCAERRQTEQLCLAGLVLQHITARGVRLGYGRKADVVKHKVLVGFGLYVLCAEVTLGVLVERTDFGQDLIVLSRKQQLRLWHVIHYYRLILGQGQSL